jgi:hypothetical protein
LLFRSVLPVDSDEYDFCSGASETSGFVASIANCALVGRSASKTPLFLCDSAKENPNAALSDDRYTAIRIGN